MRTSFNDVAARINESPWLETPLLSVKTAPCVSVGMEGLKST